MKRTEKNLPVKSFKDPHKLRLWLMKNHQTSDGLWVKIYKKNSGIESVTFEEVLVEGLCFGWSESLRHKGDNESYLQRFTPRQTKGTVSKRNIQLVKRLINEKKMMPAGLAAMDV